MSMQMWGVRYYKDEKLKQKEFELESDARRFFERVSRRDGKAQLFRFWKESWLDAIRNWEMVWFEKRIPVVYIVGFVLLVGSFVWGII